MKCWVLQQMENICIPQMNCNNYKKRLEDGEQKVNKEHSFVEIVYYIIFFITFQIGEHEYWVENNQLLGE